MLTAVVLVLLLAWATLLALTLARLVDRFERRRLDRVAAQVQVTDAVHGALGAIVAPTVAKRRGRPWTVTMGLAPGQLGAAGDLTEIARQALGREGTPVRIVFVPRNGS
jgi:hypothetical protein